MENLGTQSKRLTLDLVFTKTRSDRLENIKNLNLWGNDLEDLSLIEQMPNLHVVSLSVNRISSLKDFAHCSQLQELYLRKNNIADLSEIVHLMKLPNLKVLWLHDNPCAQVQYYRQIVIKHLPSLGKLDNNPITPEERLNAQKISVKYQLKEEKNRHDNSMVNEDLQTESRLPESKWAKKQAQDNLGKVRRTSEKQEEHFENKPEERPGLRKSIPLAYEGINTYKDEKEQVRHRNTPIPVQLNSQPSPQAQSPFLKSQQQFNRDVERNQNIVMAIMSLLQELDSNSLEIIKREAEKLLNS